jgi:hypothetical protein
MEENKQGFSVEFLNHIENIIRTITNNKKKLCIEPNYATTMEIINAAKGQKYDPSDVKKALSVLYSQKRINWGHIVNDKYFYCRTQKQD